MSSHPSKPAIAVLLLGLATACASDGGALRGLSGGVGSGPADDPRLHLELIERMLEGGKLHAALAHLDALEPGVAARPQAQLLRAESLRRLGESADARQVYEALLATEAAAPAWRGLALIEAESGDLETAVEWLGRARDLQPTAARFRNDLGYALLLRGDLDAARRELLTALELGDGRRAARNLVLLHLLAGERQAAVRLARQHGIDAQGVDRLQRRAHGLRARTEEGGGA